MTRTRNQSPLLGYNFPQSPRSPRQITRRLPVPPAMIYDWREVWRDFARMPRPEFDAMVNEVAGGAGPELQREARIARTNLDVRGLGQLGTLELLLKLGVLLNEVLDEREEK